MPTSGRSYGEMPQVLKQNPYIRYYIGSDDGTIYDKKTDTTHRLSLPKQLGHFVLDKLFEYEVNMMLHADNVSYVDADMHDADVYREHNYSENWIKFVFATNEPVKNFKQFAYTKDVELFCVFFKNQDELLECKEFFASHSELLVAQPNKHNLEIFWKNSGKGNAVWLLADLLNIDRAKTIAVDDSTNDFTMVKQAGLGLAMQNAVDELKNAAAQIICDNNEHSAKYILENYIL